MKFYAGIGSQETPLVTLRFMRGLAHDLEDLGYTLRSGGAEGADSAFESGTTRANRRIYLPWQGFNGKTGIVIGHVPTYTEIARQHHPAWNKLSPGGKALHTRNVAQVLGFWPESQKSEFVVCWTPGGLGGGGTGQAIRIANAYSVPVYDIGNEERLEALFTMIENLPDAPPV